MPDNQAAWFIAPRTKLEVKAASYTAPRAGEIVVRNRAVAINPVDWAIPVMGNLMFPWLKPPTVLGADLAGEVVEIGPDVTRFQVGDRVLGHACGLNKNRNRAAEGAFQLYSVVSVNVVARIPDTMTFETAAVLPLGFSTAACGLFQKDFLALAAPRANAPSVGKTLLVWGGATSVGSNAIQLARAAGYDVYATASPKNFGYVEKLGALRPFDYDSPTVVADIVAALHGRTLAGAVAIATGSAGLCLDVVGACAGDKFVAVAGAPVSLNKVAEGPGGIAGMLPLLPQMILGGASAALKARTRGIRTKFIFGSSLVDNEVGAMVYNDFLEAALADGRYLAAPPPRVVGSGLESIQGAFEAQQKGVSATKIVVSL